MIYQVSRHLAKSTVWGFLALAVAVLCQSATTALGQLPATRLASLYPSGVQLGTSLEVTIAGADLDDVDQLHFSHPGLSAKVKMAEPGPFDNGPQPVPKTFVVTAAGNVPPGLYDVRAVGRYGISNPRAFVVTELAQTTETEPNNDPAEATELVWPGELSGRSQQAGDVDYYRFVAKPNERLIIRCLSRSIDSRMDPVMVLYNETGEELQSARDGHRGDPVLDFTAPRAGEYLLKVYDSRYNGNDDYFYRLRIGVLPHIDLVFPPAGQAGGNRPFTVYGRNLPGGQPAGFAIDGKPIQKLGVNIPIPSGAALDELTFNALIDSEAAGLDGKEYRLGSPQGMSNPVLVFAAASAVVLEQEPNNTADKAQLVTAPCEIAGQFFPERDQDWYQFEAKEGEEYIVELISQRLGRPTDATLHVQRTIKAAEGEDQDRIQTVATADDASLIGAAEFNARTFDPALRFKVPADGTYRVLVRDGLSEVTGDPRNVYRLIIRQPSPDFRLAAAAGNPHGGSVLLRKGGSAEVRVVAFRRDGFDGEINITVAGLPAGVTCPAVTIGPARDSATLVLSAAENAAVGMGLLQVTGEATVAGGAAKRTARFGAPLWPLTMRQQNTPQLPGRARVTRNLAISVSADETAAVHLQAGADKVWETSRAGILKIPYAVTRRNGFTGTLACMVDDLPPNVTAQPFTINGNQATGEFQINLRNDTPTGTYTVRLAALAQPMPYIRNPDAAKRAAERKAEMEKILADLTTKSQAATAAKAAGDKAVADATAALQAATVAKQAADKAAADTEAAAKAATESAATSKAAAAKAPDDANLAAAATAAQKAADDAAVQVKAAALAAVAAQKALDDVDAAAKLAAEGKVKSDAAAAEAAQLLTLGQAAKAEADRVATATENAAKQQNLNNVYVPSTPITLKITAAPISVALGSPKLQVKQGAMAELPVTLTRLYAYADPVTVSAVFPPGVTGIAIPNVAIPNGQTQGKLAINAAANTTVGEHLVTVRATFSLNGQQLTVDTPVALVIEKVEAPN